MSGIGRGGIAVGSGETTMKRATRRIGRGRGRRESGQTRGATDGGTGIGPVRPRMKATIMSDPSDRNDVENAVEHRARRRTLSARTRTNKESGAAGTEVNVQSDPGAANATVIALTEMTQIVSADTEGEPTVARGQGHPQTMTSRTEKTTKQELAQDGTNLVHPSQDVIVLTLKINRTNKGKDGKTTTMSPLVNDLARALVYESLSRTLTNRHHASERPMMPSTPRGRSRK